MSGKRPKRKVAIRSNEKLDWHKGTFCKINPKSIFIKPLETLPSNYSPRDVYLNPTNISPHLLPVKAGDSVEFVLGDRDKSRPMARKVKITKYTNRSWQEIQDYLANLLDDLKSMDGKKVLMESLSNSVQWSFFGSPCLSPGQDDEPRLYYIMELIEVLLQVLLVGKPCKTLVEEAMKNVTQGLLFRAYEDKSLPSLIKSSTFLPREDVIHVRDGNVYSIKTKIFRNFCENVVCQVPSTARFLLPTVTAICEKSQNPTTQSFLLKILSTSLSSQSSGVVADEGIWQNLPFIPTENEMAGNLVEEDRHLSKVRNTYSDSETYMDTYFRLLRAETFSGIQHGIKDLKACELDERDMNVYYNVHLAGFEVQNGRFSLVIHFTSVKIVRNWKTSSQLMFGNLVCLSLNRKFDDVIWAVVSNRDAELLNKYQIIMLELIDFNLKTISQIVISLQAQAGSAVMVESPTYYHAFNPVLQSLKEFDIENFPLRDEIVQGIEAEGLPEYLQRAESVNTKPIYKKTNRFLRPFDNSNDISNGEMSFQGFLQVFNRYSSTSLESSQCEALIHALTSKLAIVQGPPGCGKTFIGAKIVQLLLSLSPKLEKPILLLTYKNHALDEFLKHMLDFCDINDMVRIGSRSKEPRLESCTLQEVMKTLQRDKSYSKTLHENIMETKQEIRDMESQIKNLSQRVDASSHLTKRKLIYELSEQQLCSLVLNIPSSVKFGKNIDKSIVRSLIESVLQFFPSFKEFCTTSLSNAIPNDLPNVEHCQFIYTFFNTAVQAWLPSRQEPQRMKAFQAEYVYRVRKPEEDNVEEDDNVKANNETDASQQNTNEEDSGDEEHVNELLESRMFSRMKTNDKSRDGLTLFKSFETSKNATNKNKKKNSQENTTNNKTYAKNKDVLIDIADYPNDMQVNPKIRSVKNLWQLDTVERLQFLYCLLSESTSNTSEEFDELLETLEILKKRKEELEMDKKVEVLSQKKIIGVTITGASINHDLLHQIGPSVVIVEEAAEILEPSLLAALTPSIQHLVLIGDHKQLRPNVDTYKLRTDFNFDISMMERLINAGYPYKTLRKQNRMRPEFSALLKDIYPTLDDNLDLVSKNEPLKCISHSMFFWSHSDPEKKDRTFTNTKEAERIIALVLYLLSSGIPPSEITVIAAYLGQTKLLRKMMKQLKTEHPQLFDKTADDQTAPIEVQTVDMYQGDENNYVIISLVRSNSHGGIGFLKEMNRRCVAQSRAKRGMYFVGNKELFMNARKSVWKNVIRGMEAQGCTGNAIPLQCTKHDVSPFYAVTGDDIKRVVNNPKLLCSEICGELNPCFSHICQKPCIPHHDHDVCHEIVHDYFPNCGHPVKRECKDDISELLCRVEVIVTLETCGHQRKKECHQRNSDLICDELVMATFPKCRHQIEKKCHENIENLTCPFPCTEFNNCFVHKCKKMCGEPHSHETCPEMVYYRYPDCGHLSSKKKKCSQPITDKCGKLVEVTGACGHKIKKPCHQAEIPPCMHQCEKTYSCGIHRCEKKCGIPHDHNNCQEMIDYKFPGCQHQSSKKKRCSEEITWKCKHTVFFKGSCGHEIKKECHQKNEDVMCTAPCTKMRKCNHMCTNLCGEDCEKGDCAQCLEEHEKRMKKFREDAMKRKIEIAHQMKQNPVPFSIKEISPTGSDSGKYQMVKDKVLKYIQPMHHWFPNITKIEEVTNQELEKRFEAAKSRAFGNHIDKKFHGTSEEGVKGITKGGFKLPNQNAKGKKRGMYGQGIYFATDSSKSAQTIYTKGSQKLLLCDVLLGKSKVVHKEDNSLNKQKLNAEKCDSVYAPRGSAVKNDEYVIFDPDQALPLYIIHFATKIPYPSTILSQTSVTVKKMLPTRTIDFQDPFNAYYNAAESHFLRMSKQTNPALTEQITSIDIVINKDLEKKFEATRKTFRMLGINDKEILAYHGTDPVNIPSIIKTNLQLSFARRQAYGKGNYFSEYPKISLDYGKGLLLCRILPGKEFVDATSRDIPAGYNSKKVLLKNQTGTAKANASGEMIIIEDSNQILPFYVIYR